MSDDEIHKLAERANHKNANAQTLMGVAYMEGVRMPHDDVEAVRWLSKAAAQGQP